jgi:hypothetical protein
VEETEEEIFSERMTIRTSRVGYFDRSEHTSHTERVIISQAGYTAGSFLIELVPAFFTDRGPTATGLVLAIFFFVHACCPCFVLLPGL